MRECVGERKLFDFPDLLRETPWMSFVLKLSLLEIKFRPCIVVTELAFPLKLH
jgi:hypothetical protein